MKMPIAGLGLLLSLTAADAGAMSASLGRVPSSPGIQTVLPTPAVTALAGPGLAAPLQMRPSTLAAPLTPVLLPAKAPSPQAVFAQLSADAPRIAPAGENVSAQRTELDRFFDKKASRAAADAVYPAPAADARPSGLSKAAAARRQSGQVHPATIYTAAAVLGPVAAGAAAGAHFGKAALLGLPGWAVAGVILASLMLTNVMLLIEDTRPPLPGKVRLLLRAGAAITGALGLGLIGVGLGILPLPMLGALAGVAALVLLILALMGNDYVRDRDRR